MDRRIQSAQEAWESEADAQELKATHATLCHLLGEPRGDVAAAAFASCGVDRSSLLWLVREDQDEVRRAADMSAYEFSHLIHIEASRALEMLDKQSPRGANRGVLCGLNTFLGFGAASAESIAAKAKARAAADAAVIAAADASKALAIEATAEGSWPSQAAAEPTDEQLLRKSARAGSPAPALPAWTSVPPSEPTPMREQSRHHAAVEGSGAVASEHAAAAKAVDGLIRVISTLNKIRTSEPVRLRDTASNSPRAAAAGRAPAEAAQTAGEGAEAKEDAATETVEARRLRLKLMLETAHAEMERMHNVLETTEQATSAREVARAKVMAEAGASKSSRPGESQGASAREDDEGAHVAGAFAYLQRQKKAREVASNTESPLSWDAWSDNLVRRLAISWL